MKKSMSNIVAIIAMIVLVAANLVGCMGNSSTVTQTANSTTTSATTESSTTATESSLFDNINIDTAMPVVKEEISVEIAFIPQSQCDVSQWNKDTFWMAKYFDNVTGMDITWTLIDPASSNETITLMMASGDLPDAIQGGYYFDTANVMKYGVSQGLLRSIDDLLVYCPTFSAIMEEQPETKASITATDGHIYSFPILANGNYSYSLRYFINQDWLDNVDMDNPTSLDALYDVLTAFKESDANGNGDANDEIPFSGSWDEQYSERNLILTAFGYPNEAGNTTLDYTEGDEDVSVVYIPYEDTYYDYLVYMNKLYSEGLIDQDIFTQSETQFQAKISEGIIGLFGGASTKSYYPSDPDIYTALNALVDQEGDTPYYPEASAVSMVGMAVISSDVEDETAAALCKFFDYYFTEEFFIFDYYGPEYGSDLDYFGHGTSYNDETGSVDIAGLGDLSGWNFWITYVSFWEVPGYGTRGNNEYQLDWAEKHPDSVVAKSVANSNMFDKFMLEMIERIIPYCVEEMPTLWFGEEDQNRIEELLIPLDDYVASMEAKFITSELNIDDNYDEFITTLKEYGVEEYVQIYNKYYDQYKANLE